MGGRQTLPRGGAAGRVGVWPPLGKHTELEHVKTKTRQSVDTKLAAPHCLCALVSVEQQELHMHSRKR